MTDTPRDLEAEVRDLARSVTVYRVALLVLVALFGVVTWRSLTTFQVGEFGVAGEVWTVDLAERKAWVDREKANQHDFSETYYATNGASVHMHFMGRGQTTPLHFHPDSHEATIIAGGTAHVTSLWGTDGALTRLEQDYGPGTLVASGPRSAHEWHNPDDGAYLANLVFTKPKFSGNLYVKEDDPRLLSGAPPEVVPPAAGLTAFTATGAPSKVTRLTAMDGRMAELYVADAWTLPDNLRKPVVGYVVAGAGEVDGHPLRPAVLVYLESGSDKVVRAEPGKPLALVLFDPFGALGT